MHRFLSIFILLLLTTPAAQAQWPDWDRLPGPTGGLIQSFTAVDGDIIAAPYLGAFYHSTDAGVTWEFLFEAPWTRNTYTLHGTADGMLFALGYSGTYRSSDHGQSWTKCNVGETALFAASQADGTVLLGLRGSVAISTDKGVSWTTTTPSPGSSRDYKVAADLAGNWYAGAYQVGLFRSSNRGQTWESIEAGLPSNALYSISVPTGDVVFIGLNSATYRSSDQGATWNHISDLAAMNVFSVQHAGGNTMVTETSKGLYLSQNFGATWETGTLAPFVDTYGLFAQRNGLILFSDNGRVIRSSDKAATFEISDAGLYLQNITAVGGLEDGNMLAANEGGGLYRSTDNGEHWQYATPGRWDYTVKELRIGFERYAHALTDDGELLITTDNGDSWAFRYDSLGVGPFLSIQGLEDFYTVSSEGRFFHYSGYNRVWDERGTIQPSAGSIGAATLATFDSVFLIGTDRGLFRSTDRGYTWDLVLIEGLPKWFTEIIVNLPWGSEAFASTGDAVYRSSDRGATWTIMTGNFSSPQQLTYNPDRDIYLLDEDSIHYVKQPDHPGNVWQTFPAAPFSDFTCLEFCPWGNEYWGHILLGSRSHGLFRSVNWTLSSPSPEKAAEQFSITNLYPLPLTTMSGSAATLNLQLELLSSASVVVEVCDMLGRTLQHFDQGRLAAGRNNIRISVSAEATGMLLLRVHGPGGMQQRLLPSFHSVK
ncbi:MAG: hypothetical protein WBQ23_14205 [Bacteroidota bacterium]